MERNQMLEIATELMSILEEKKVTPIDAENISFILAERIKEENDKEKKKYMVNGVFKMSPSK